MQYGGKIHALKHYHMLKNINDEVKDIMLLNFYPCTSYLTRVVMHEHFFNADVAYQLTNVLLKKILNHYVIVTGSLEVSLVIQILNRCKK